jgi:hypothetical protein
MRCCHHFSSVVCKPINFQSFSHKPMNQMQSQVHKFTNASTFDWLIDFLLTGPSKDHTSKVLLQLAQWFLRRTFLCEFPIVSYVKLSSAVGAILVEGPGEQKMNLLFWNYWANLNQSLLKRPLGGPLPNWRLAFQPSDQDGRHSRT